MREISETEVEPLEHLYWPFLECLNAESLYALKYCLSKDYHKKLILPGEVKLTNIGNVQKEMSQAPASESHMRAT